MHKCSTGKHGNIFKVFEKLLKGHCKGFVTKKPTLKNTGHLGLSGRRRKWKWCRLWLDCGSIQNTLTHSAAVERFSASVFKMRVIKRGTYRGLQTELTCTWSFSWGEKKKIMESIKIHSIQLIWLTNNKACNCASAIKVTSGEWSRVCQKLSESESNL